MTERIQLFNSPFFVCLSVFLPIDLDVDITGEIVIQSDVFILVLTDTDDELRIRRTGNIMDTTVFLRIGFGDFSLRGTIDIVGDAIEGIAGLLELRNVNYENAALAGD